MEREENGREIEGKNSKGMNKTNRIKRNGKGRNGVVTEMENKVLDFAEAKLYKLIEAENPQAIMFILKTKEFSLAVK